LQAVACREIAEVPEAERQRDRLDAFGAGKQLPADEPKPPQPQVAVQAHAAVAQDRIVHRADRHSDLLRELLAVDRPSETALQDIPDFAKYLELPGRIGKRGPSRRYNLRKHTIDAGEQGLTDGRRRLAQAWLLAQLPPSRQQLGDKRAPPLPRRRTRLAHVEIGRHLRPATICYRRREDD